MNWLKLLQQCKDNVQSHIRPLLGKSCQPQPCLGIGAGGDPIKQIDLEAEKAIIETLREKNISFTLISEESGVKEYGQHPNENYVTIDPIDGTTNLTRGLPFYATSIAVSNGIEINTVHTALVADLFHNKTYTAQKGLGAYCNGRKITPSKQVDLEDAVVGIDLNTYRVREIAPRITKVIERTKHIRHLGANALELCYVADGTIDAFIDIRGKLRTTDMAAAWLIIKEAGGEITTPNGQSLNAKLSPKERVAFLASANKGIHDLILELLRA
ncbi:fructose 1,6-bisphosphatase [Candidatus Bathyarchaeota archaeon]|nr:fructose 1,6-bisphosphatase [Candidatus Bathyarchaeota archaeon]